MFDAYREQENHPVKYSRGNDLRGLENVLYQCPHCQAEFTVENVDKDRLRCSACGYEQQSDEYGFLHKASARGKEIRYVSDWSRLIYHRLKETILGGELESLTAETAIHMIDYDKKKFFEVGQGILRLNSQDFHFEGRIRGQDVTLTVPIAGVPTLPFKPGKNMDLQQGSDIYRCVLSDGRLVMKFINMVKIFHELGSKKS